MMRKPQITTKLSSFKEWCVCVCVCVCACVCPAGLMLTVSSNQSFDAFAPPLTESVHHEEQQREDEEGRDTTDDESHPAGHRVKQTVSI